VLTAARTGYVILATSFVVHGLTESQGYTLHNGVTNSSPGLEQNCRQAQTATAFLWFGWAAFVATLVFSAMAGKGGAVRGGVRRGGPSMSQV
jgi:hypothetical protein